MKKGDQRGVSPVVATVLLVAMVIVIALIIFLWFKGIGGELITKFDGTNIELVCGNVQFLSDYNNEELFISNIGNVPIFGMKVKIERSGGYDTLEISGMSDNWPVLGLNQGGAFHSGDISGFVSGATRLVLTPVLMGTSDKGERTYMCDEGQHGFPIEVY